MGARIAFYFDLVGFRTELKPLLGSIQKHDLSELRQAAQEVGRSMPSVWNIARYFGYYADELGNEDIEYDTELGRLHFWMMTLVCGYCRQVPDIAGARATLDALSWFGLSETIIDELWTGRPFGALLLPEIEHRTAQQWIDPEWPYWAQGYGVGWLEQADMRRLYSLLTTNKKYISAKIAADASAEHLIAYESVMAMLRSGLEQDTWLLVGVAV